MTAVGDAEAGGYSLALGPVHEWIFYPSHEAMTRAVARWMAFGVAFFEDTDDEEFPFSEEASEALAANQDASPCQPGCGPCRFGLGVVCICGPECDPPTGGEFR
ncbi:hypothetical protein [Micromonospora sp. NBC_01796]|uniref:hypothetical protein n=1 Tax=Micromonospora sp. NBC_01796 TaxID=2975987 RepID=UPI002DD8DEA6|nr:hypothetical protein [Micromonospora sp. NBC_01796]WSA88076.1 hypothetical protein OIE47_10955 [Micromonospora sp. NBC_01796]